MQNIDSENVSHVHVLS